MDRARLTENRSTAPTFRDGDLLVANLLPIATLVHQISFVVRVDGRFESSERVTGIRDKNSIYHKETGSIPSHDLEQLRNKIQALAIIAEPILRYVSQFRLDPFEAETADRRSLGYEFQGEHRTLCTWMLNADPSDDQRAECIVLFNEVWQHLLSLVTMQYFAFDGTFDFPVRSHACPETNRDEPADARESPS